MNASPTAGLAPVRECTPSERDSAVPLASIIIVNHNGRDYMTNCLRSLFACGLASAEVIVVDNNSDDGSLDAISDIPGIRLINCQENHGFGRAGNLGAAHARGRYLVFLNPDTTVTHGWLDPLIAALEADPSVGLVTPKILLMDDPWRINTAGNDVHFTGLTLCRGMGFPAASLADTTSVGAVSGAAFVVRRKLFLLLGGFDPHFFMYMEDTDLSWRARLTGYICLYVPESVLYHDYLLRFGPRKSYYQERNRYQMLLKCLRWQTLLRLLPALVLAEVITWGFIVLRQRDQCLGKLRAYAGLLRPGSRLIERRVHVQRMRRVSDHVLLATTKPTLDFGQAASGYPAEIAEKLFDPLFKLLYRLVMHRL